MAFTALSMLYICFNMASALGIVFTNKAVFAVFNFHYPVLLTLIHILFSMIGMQLMSAAGFFEAKTIPFLSLIDLAAAYVAYIVLGNVSIKLNPVGFYQITKALIAPTILFIQSIKSRKLPTVDVVASIVLLTIGICIATVTDDQVMGNFTGMLIGIAYVLSTALYNIWAGSKQKQLHANSSQLLHRFAPIAAMLLAASIPVTERTALIADPTSHETPFEPTVPAVATIMMSACLGLLVTLSTFLVIGNTSALTYNVVGHIKTVGIIAGGVIFYGEVMPMIKFFGLMVAAGGIGWYSYIKMREVDPPKALTEPKSPRYESHQPVRSPRANPLSPRSPRSTPTGASERTASKLLPSNSRA